MKNNNSVRDIATSLLLLIAGCLLHASTHAQDEEIRYSLFLGANYSDNAERLPINGSDEVAAEVGGSLEFFRESPGLDLDIKGDGALRTYTQETFDDEFIGGVSGNMTFKISPERLEWTVTDDFGQTQTDLAQTETPDNRGDYNFFSTGPTLRLPIGDVTYLTADLRYSDLYFELRDDGYEDLSAQLGIARAVSPNRSLGLLVSTSDIQFDEDPARDSEIQSAFLRLNSRAARSELEIDIGYNEIERAIGSGSGELLRARYTRSLSSRLSLGLSARRSFVAAGEALQELRSLPGQNLGNPILGTDASQPVELTAYSASLDYETERSTFSISASAYEEEPDVDGMEFKRDRRIYRVNWTRILSSSVAVDLRVDYDEDELPGLATALERTGYGAGLAWRASTKLTIRFGLQFSTGDGGAGQPNFDYEEAEANLRLIYAPR